MTDQLKQAWTDLQYSRWQNASWDLDQTVTTETMQEIIDEVHDRSPAKQNRVNYKMEILDWSDTELRNAFYEMAVDRDAPVHKYNAQTLANWLIVFHGRIPANFHLDFSNVPSDSLDVAQMSMEVGMAAFHVIHGAAARGLQCGFCRCLDFDYTESWDIIEDRISIHDRHTVSLVLGVGIPNTENTHQTYNPHTGLYVDAYKDQKMKWKNEPKPAQTEYINWITS